MKQQTTQDKEVKETLNVGTLGQDERIRADIKVTHYIEHTITLGSMQT